MTDLDQKAAELKARVEAADRRRGQAEGQLEHARAMVAKASDLIRQEFGIEPEQAGKLLARLDAQAAAEAAKVEQALQEAGG